MLSRICGLTKKKQDTEQKQQPVQEVHRTLLYSELNGEQKNVMLEKLADLLVLNDLVLNMGVYKLFLPYEILIDKATNTYCCTLDDKDLSLIKTYSIPQALYSNIIFILGREIKGSFVDISCHKRELTYMRVKKDDERFSNYRVIDNVELRCYGIWLDFRVVHAPPSNDEK